VLWTGLVWLRIGTGGELLWTRQWTFVFHKMLGTTEGLHKLWPLERYSAPRVSYLLAIHFSEGLKSPWVVSIPPDIRSSRILNINQSRYTSALLDLDAAVIICKWMAASNTRMRSLIIRSLHDYQVRMIRAKGFVSGLVRHRRRPMNKKYHWETWRVWLFVRSGGRKILKN
jgi:hypothetical protein